VVEYGDNQEEVFLGMSMGNRQSISEETSKKIDAEVKRLTQGGFDEARRIITERLEDLHTLAKAMLEYETLSGAEIADVLKGIPPTREEDEQEPLAGPAVSVPLTHVDPEPQPA